MKLWVKKLLAKYVTYIEIIGYGFVVLFVAGLIGLSNIKAEDEYVNLNGTWAMSAELIRFDRPHLVLEVLADTGAAVAADQPLLSLTRDERLVANHRLAATLNQPLRAAEAAKNTSLIRKLNAMRDELTSLPKATRADTVLRSRVAGRFHLLRGNLPVIEAGTAAGGCFDFGTATIRVAELPVDRRQVRKLKVGQTGTASLKLTPLTSVTVAVELARLTDDEAELRVTDVAPEVERRIVRALAERASEQAEAEPIPASVSLLVGWKSWMQLIWR